MTWLRPALALLLAGSASAQTAAPLRGVLRAPAGAPVPLVLPAPAAPAALPAAVLPTPAVALPTPRAQTVVQARIAAGVQAVADFKAASPSREAGDALWAAVVGERQAAAAAVVEPEVPAVPAAARLAPAPPSKPARTLHLLSKPLHETSELGPVARVLHYVLETAFQFAKAALLWHATGSESAALAMLAVELVKLPPMITAQSLADLQLRYWWRRRAVLRELAAEPGVAGLKVLTAAHVEFSGILARRKENTGLIFVESEGGLGAEVGRFGAPIPVSDADGTRVRLTLVQRDRTARVPWTPSLSELLSGRPLPDSIAADWRAALAENKADKGWLRRVFDFSKEKDLRVEAALVTPDGERPLGTVALGGSARKLMGASLVDRTLAWLGRAPRGRAIPLASR